MITFEKARSKAQSRKVLLDKAAEYENAFIFSYSGSISQSGREDIVVLKDTGDVYSKDQVKEIDIGKFLAEKPL